MGKYFLYSADYNKLVGSTNYHHGYLVAATTPRLYIFRLPCGKAKGRYQPDLEKREYIYLQEV